MCGPSAASSSNQATSNERRELVSLCLDQGEWLCSLAERHTLPGVEDCGRSLRRLVEQANSEPPRTKKHIFLVVRCHRCLQHTRGGDKREFEVTLPDFQWQWLESVRQRCQHPTVGKTLRIIIDFYRPILEKDSELERAVFRCRSEALSVDICGDQAETVVQTTIAGKQALVEAA